MVSLKSLLALTLATTALASPTVRRDEESGLVILEEYAAEGGTITIYGDDHATSAPKENPLQRRCGSNSVTCSNANKASYLACSSLISHLEGRGALPVSPRSVCHTVVVPQFGAQKCCASWANNVSGLRGTHLVNAARKTLSTCATGVSGKARDANLNGVCTTQCLSNRPDGCVN